MTNLHQIKAAELVKSRIGGIRRGTKDEPAYLHSLRVGEVLEKHGYPRRVRIAGILHDVVEDGDVTFDDLREQGFSNRTIELVRLCTHDKRIKNRDARWQLLVAGLVTARDRDAWAIKLADVLDNFRVSKLLPPDRAMFYRNVKAPLVLHVSEDVMGKTPIWQELKDELGTSSASSLYDFLHNFFSLKKFDDLLRVIKEGNLW